MGCDIHFYVEKLAEGQWASADKWTKGEEVGELFVAHGDCFYRRRNYDLFAILANVRNGIGFAGIKTGGGFIPIADPRGLPADVTEQVQAASERWSGDGHSHSHLSLKELLDYDWTQTTSHEGWVDVENFGNWHFGGAKNGPKEWSGDIMGPAIQKLPDHELLAQIQSLRKEDSWWSSRSKIVAALPDHYTHLIWTEPSFESTGHFWQTTIPRLLALAKGDYGSVRIVFWFDN